MFGWLKSSRRIGELERQNVEFKSWYQSAMMMIDAMPVALMWCDTAKGFEVAYVNHAAGPLPKRVAGGLPCVPDRIVGRKIVELFASIGGELA